MEKKLEKWKNAYIKCKIHFCYKKKKYDILYYVSSFYEITYKPIIFFKKYILYRKFRPKKMDLRLGGNICVCAFSRCSNSIYVMVKYIMTVCRIIYLFLHHFNTIIMRVKFYDDKIVKYINVGFIIGMNYYR